MLTRRQQQDKRTGEGRGRGGNSVTTQGSKKRKGLQGIFYIIGSGLHVYISLRGKKLAVCNKIIKYDENFEHKIRCLVGV